MPRFRTLTKTYDYLKTLDAETAITPYALRRMVITGHIPSIKIGKKYLIDIDLLASAVSRGKAEIAVGNEKIARPVDNIEFIPMR